jgi:hypothetical protein
MGASTGDGIIISKPRRVLPCTGQLIQIMLPGIEHGLAGSVGDDMTGQRVASVLRGNPPSRFMKSKGIASGIGDAGEDRTMADAMATVH